MATKKAASLVDTLRWTEPDGTVREEDDAKGQTFELPESEFDRLAKAGAVAAPSSKDAKAAKDAAAEADAGVETNDET